MSDERLIPLVFDQAIISQVIYGLKVLGLTSFASLVSLYTAWIALFPELTIEAVVEKSKKMNSESQIKIKNLGKLPAFKVCSTITDLNVVVNGLNMQNCEIHGQPDNIPRLAGGESVEIPIATGFHTVHGTVFSEFEYRLTLEYNSSFMFFKRKMKKAWVVKLRNLDEEFYWGVKLAA